MFVYGSYCITNMRYLKLFCQKQEKIKTILTILFKHNKRSGSCLNIRESNIVML